MMYAKRLGKTKRAGYVLSLQRVINILMPLALLALLLVLLTIQAQPREVIPMAIEYPNLSVMDFGVMPAPLANLGTRSIGVWLKIDGTASGGHAILNGYVPPSGPSSDKWSFYYDDAGKLHFWFPAPGGNGWWYANKTMTVGTIYFVGVSYDKGSVANDPIFYDSTGPLTTIESSAPATTMPDDSAANLFSGGIYGYANLSMMTILDIQMANVIWTAAEFAELATGRCVRIMRGDVFHPLLYGAAGLPVFGGATLGAGNKVIDQISGVQGTPTGSPIGRAETYLSVCR